MLQYLDIQKWVYPDVSHVCDGCVVPRILEVVLVVLSLKQPVEVIKGLGMSLNITQNVVIEK